MKIWLTTDTHFGHDKMRQYCGRPENFEKLILNNLSKLEDNDILIHLGDFCIGNDSRWHKTFNNFKFKKWLIKGNHDRKSNSWYFNNGWDFVSKRFIDKYFGKKILFSHCPQKDNGEFDVNIHGHFHNNLHRLLEGRYVVDGEEERNKEDLAVLTIKHTLLALEDVCYEPILLKEILRKSEGS